MFFCNVREELPSAKKNKTYAINWLFLKIDSEKQKINQIIILIVHANKTFLFAALTVNKNLKFLTNPLMINITYNKHPIIPNLIKNQPKSECSLPGKIVFAGPIPKKSIPGSLKIRLKNSTLSLCLAANETS